MGTRTVIRLKKGNKTVDLYRHWDGFPEEILYDFNKIKYTKSIDEIIDTLNDNYKTKMRNYYESNFKSENPGYTQEDVDEFLKKYDSDERNQRDIYSITDQKEGIHGDIDFLYHYDGNSNFMRSFKMDYEPHENSYNPNTEFSSDKTLISLLRLYDKSGRSVEELTGHYENYYDKRIAFHETQIKEAIRKKDQPLENAYTAYKERTERLKVKIPALSLNNPENLKESYYFKDIKEVSHYEYFRAVEEVLHNSVKNHFINQKDEDLHIHSETDRYFDSFFPEEYQYKSDQTLISNLVDGIKQSDTSLSTTEAVNKIVEKTAEFLQVDKETLDKQINELKSMRVDARVLNRTFEYIAYKKEKDGLEETLIEKEKEFLEKAEKFQEKYGVNDLFNKKIESIKQELEQSPAKAPEPKLDPLAVLEQFEQSKETPKEIENSQEMVR